MPRLAILAIVLAACGMNANAAGFSRAVAPVTLDGKLDDDAWNAASPADLFFEVYPRNVAPPRQRTEARFLFDDRYIYIGIRAFDAEPENIRSGLTRRDQVDIDQDYVEVMLDPLNAGRSAVVLRTNPQGVQTDGIFSEDTGTRSLLPDFDFDVRTTVDAEGWAAEFRIPLSTLRYSADAKQAWTVVIYRNVPREVSSTIASVPVPRGANCVLCYATPLGEISISGARAGTDLTPYIAYSHRDDSQQVRAGLDVKWHARPQTTVDLTIEPDFSQVEADELQLTANARFALAVTEKRPFFLEGADLLTTPLQAIYTRAFADPAAGLRVTHRGETSEYVGVVLRDDGGGTLIEPGPVRSRAVPEPGKSSSVLGRYARLTETTSWGSIATLRSYGDGSDNAVLGFDATWAPSTSDRLSAQLLFSRTSTPQRTDLVDSWDGRSMTGTAEYLNWRHAADSWYTTATFRGYSHGFRSWSGFIPQVGVSKLTVVSGLYFYPQAHQITRISPLVSVTDTAERGGERINRVFSPGLAIELPRDTTLTFTLSPNSEDMTQAGRRSYSNWSLSLSSTPAPWMPEASLTFSDGELLDFSTGEVGQGRSIEALIPLRLFDRLELDTAFSYQSLDSPARTRLFSERNVEVSAIWHFSNRLYAQSLYQTSRLSTVEAALETESVTRRASFLLSYQASWQTRYFVGVRSGDSNREVFAKLSYVMFH